MKGNGMRLISILYLVSLAGCTDAEWSKVTAFGGSQHIKCWSGGQVVYEGDSTGKVQSEKASDGYFFEEVGTKRLIEISADCMFYANK